MNRDIRRREERDENGNIIFACGTSFCVEESSDNGASTLLLETEEKELKNVFIPADTACVIIEYRINKLKKSIDSYQKELPVINDKAKKAEKEAAKKQRKANRISNLLQVRSIIFGALISLIFAILAVLVIFYFYGTIKTATGSLVSFSIYLLSGIIPGAFTYVITKKLGKRSIKNNKKASKDQSIEAKALAKEAESVSEKMSRAQEELKTEEAKLHLMKQGYSITTVGV